MVAAALPEVAVVPHVLADADAESPAAQIEQLRAVERLEVAVLVKHVVGRQERLAEPLLGASASQQHGGVEERSAGVGRIRLGQTHEHGRLAGQLAGELADDVPAPRHEGRAEEQVARQIADERELGRDGQVGAQAAGLAHRVRNHSSIAGEVADERIDLQERDFHSVYARSHFSLT